MELLNKVAVITGGSKGIGLAIAEAMLSQKMKVAITGASDRIMEVGSTLSARFPGQVLAVKSDVRNYQAQEELVQKILNEFGRIDVLIANAGIGHFAPIDEMTPTQWNEVMDINLTGVFNSLRTSVAALKSSKGYFISIASLAGANFFAKGAAYNASKFGLVGFTQAAMLDLRVHGIKTSTIMPGSVATHFNGNIPSDKDNWKIQPEDVAKVVIDLLTMPSRSLPSKIEMRPSFPQNK